MDIKTAPQVSEEHKLFTGANDGDRTRYLHLGKVALYQMSYIRIEIHQT